MNTSHARHQLSYPPDNVQGLTMFLTSISGLVVEYIFAIDVTRARFPADAFAMLTHSQSQSEQIILKADTADQLELGMKSLISHLYMISGTSQIIRW